MDGSGIVHENVKRNGNAAGMGEWEMPIQSQAEAEAAQVSAAYCGEENAGEIAAGIFLYTKYRENCKAYKKRRAREPCVF